MSTVMSKSDPSGQRVVPSEHRSDVYDRFYADLHKQIKQEGFFPGSFALIMNVFDGAAKGELRYAGLGALEKMMRKVSPETPERKQGLEFLRTASVPAEKAIVSRKVYHNFKKEELHCVGGKLQDYFKGLDPNREDEHILSQLTSRQRYGEYPVLNSIVDIKNSAYLSIPLIYKGKEQGELTGVIHLVYELTKDTPVPDSSRLSLVIDLSSLFQDTWAPFALEYYNQKKFPPVFHSHR